MVKLTILRDTREQRGWEFNNHDADVKDETLETGDYTIAEFCDYDSDLDTYYPSYAIERKSGSDFVKSIGASRDRFEKEVRRASDWESPLLVLVEEPQYPSRYGGGSHFLDYTEMTESQVYGTVDSWERQYNVSFQFTGDRRQAQRITYDTLLTKLRAELF